MAEQHSSGHEPIGVNARAIAWWGLALVVLIAVSLALLAGLLKLRGSVEARDVPRVAEPRRGPLVEPSLDPAQRQNLRQLRAVQQTWLDSYGWIDHEAGIVHIPVDRAMEMMAEEGLQQ